MNEDRSDGWDPEFQSRHPPNRGYRARKRSVGAMPLPPPDEFAPEDDEPSPDPADPADPAAQGDDGDAPE